ncbi:tyrosine-protein phosphatase 69D [Ischnura elegans]|uniref:tyrosine-protein phosphatase 69D n=1 Tax=Ischnura elegans TaxID=197161 RepID=UPI001ED8A800|nr:tyrosine-protein phosphatase 69D [Ischnura elegans]
MMGSQAQMPSRMFVVIFLSCFVLQIYVTADQPTVEITKIPLERSDYSECENVTMICKVAPTDSIIWWEDGDGRNVVDDRRYIMSNETIGDVVKSSLHILCLGLEDAGNYTCHASDNTYSENVTEAFLINVEVFAEVLETKGARELEDKEVILSCLLKGYPLSLFYWQKGDDDSTIETYKNLMEIETKNQTLVEMKLKINTSVKSNGTYYCKAMGPQGEVSGSVPLFVRHKPQAVIDFVKAVGSTKMYVNWTVNSGNEPILNYLIWYMTNESAQWTLFNEKILGDNTSAIITGLKPNHSYDVKLQARNVIGDGESKYGRWVRTLEKDPEFVPYIEVKGVSRSSVTVGWSAPPPEIVDLVHYYELKLQDNNTEEEADYPTSDSPVDSKPSYSFENLSPATTYYFKVRACSEYGRHCWNWTKGVNGTTMDGEPGPPKNVNVSCKFDSISRKSIVYVSWEPPTQMNGKIMHYRVILEGDSIYKNEKGDWGRLTLPIKSKSVDEKYRSILFDDIPPNTNYTVKVSGFTRSRTPGPEVNKTCSMPPTTPDKLKDIRWKKIEEQGLIKLFLPRVSERNGPICCYRIILIKLEPQQTTTFLPAPQDVLITTYDDVHNKKGGAYVAEMFESDKLASEIFLGDGITSNVETSQCRACLATQPPPEEATTSFAPLPTHPPTTAYVSSNAPTTTPSTPPTSAPKTQHPITQTTTPAPATTFEVIKTETNPPSTAEPPAAFLSETVTTAGPPLSSSVDSIISRVLRELRSSRPYMTRVQDGQLDLKSNYTGFVEITVLGPNNSVYTAYSDYFPQLNPGPQVIIAESSSQLVSIILQVLCAIIFVVLILLLAICLLQRYTKQVAEAQGVEMTLRNSFRHLCRGLRGGHVLVSSSPPDMTPIAKENLVAAFIERHRDSDYGFQHEFELLPDRFPDRTTRASEARENMYKNRYPDIKAYDQTRVKLSCAENVIGGDYINANFVVGYKERKKFICAQGPMDNTVCDFWRMIWEQHLELILMLTNLEEYSKTKCAKYWPDEGDKVCGDISISHVQEKRYSDYIIRELKMTRTFADKEKEERSIIQYHFLVWKDFMAPEHPSGILKFIKRMNEAYSLEKGPILVHCSAGVGRTGTLVALDSLLQQLEDEGQVSIFNTVCDLRHQRNFLVQSLKQYIFVYRALMEVAQFGDTELKISKLKSAVERLRLRENGKEKCQMEEDFEKISRVIEDRKSFSVGGGEENKMKNRSELVIPYDRNRVILTPVPGREHSTYINASFIEGYDNSESFIITQDPLEVTIADFWRMISEQGITTLVMLSDLGEGPKKCLRYWPDDEVSHDHIKVKYIQSESCPYYTRREFSVTNSKTDENFIVTQFQYNGWPTVEGEVPEVTRGLIELVDQTQSHQESNGGTGPITVHCSCGAERSSIFVALSILVQQMRTEKRVDIFTATRKLRSQRHGMLQTFAQYEFLHRAIVNYVDLHHLTEEEC